jgi:16S rRNA (guanine966-N2)-methyltransferase
MTRPTSDRVREALFSTLGERVTGGVVLDLYAGSGALGIEALSRGAAHATFVERDRRVARVLRENLAELGLRATVHVTDVARFVRELDVVAPGAPFTVVLCDPPYKVAPTAVVAVLTALARSRHLARDAVLVVERARHGPALEPPEQALIVTDTRSYGDTVLYYLRRGSTGDDQDAITDE